MIIHDSYKFVYIDIPKTGSNSLDSVFLSWGGKLLPPDNQTKKHRREIPQYAESYDIIASVRNPYDRIISQFFFYQNTIKWFVSDTFEQFVDRFVDNLNREDLYAFFPMWKYLEPIGEPTHVIRLEHIREDANNLPYGRNAHIPHANKTKRKGTVEMTPAIIEKINYWAGKDFEMFGYERL